MRDGDWGPTAEKLNQSFAESLLIVRRRLPVVIAIVFLTMGAVGAYIWLAPLRYTAHSQIVFDSKLAPGVDVRPVFGEEAPDDAFIMSEVDVLQSRSLARRVIDNLHLDQNPDFNEALRPDSALTALLKKVLPARWRPIREPTTPEAEKERTIDAFQQSVAAKISPRSRTVSVSFTARQPQLAADALNTLTDLYLQARMEDRLDDAKRASAWLADQIKKLRDQAQQAERAVENYRTTNNLFETAKETLISRQIGELDSRLTDAGIERRTAEATLVQVRRLLNGSGNIDAAPQVLQSDLIRRYREDELALERREAQMTQEYGDRHPQLIQLRAEKQRLEDKIHIEIKRITTSLETQAQMAREREDALQSNLQSVKASAAQANAASIGLRTLEQQAEASKVTLERMMAALLQTSAAEDVKSQIRDSRVISPAPVPEKPSYPPKTLLVISGLVVSSFAGVLLAYILEHLDRGFRSAEQVESLCSLPVLAQVPLVRASNGDAAAYALDHPRSAFAAAVQAAHARLLLMSPQCLPKVLMFTSAEPGEGKSTISLSLARQQALAGNRVIFVEADLHRPCIARVAGVKQGPGLLDVLGLTTSIRDAIQRDSRSAVDLLVAGGRQQAYTARPPLGAIALVLDVLRGEYDLIVLDAPPVLGLADANVFAAAADATLMVVRWGKTCRQVFVYGVGEITKFGGRVDGVILSQVDTRKQAYYGYGDSHAYTGRAAKAYIG